MKKILLFLLFSTFTLFSFDYDYCPSERGEEWYYTVRSKVNPYSPPNYGVFCSSNDSYKYRYTIEAYTEDGLQKFGYICYAGYVRADSSDDYSPCVLYVPPTCDDNQTLIDGECIDNCLDGEVRVNNECIESKPFDCKASLGFNWITRDDITDLSTCESNVDGVNYTSAQFNTTDDFSYTPTCCLLPVLPNYDCSQLGDNWLGSPVNEGETCEGLVDGIGFDAYQVIADDGYSPTCCLHDKLDRPDVAIPENNDSNTTPPIPDGEESNPSTRSDIKGVEDAVVRNGEQAHADTQAVLDGINAGNTQSHSDNERTLGQLRTLTRNVTNGLTTIESTISNEHQADRTQAQSNADQAHEDATGIKDAINSLDEGREEAELSLGSIKDGFTNAMNSADSNYNSILETANSLLTSYSNTPPIFQGSGNSSFSTNVYGHDIVFDLIMFEDLRPYFDILFTLMLAWINFKIYRWIFEFLVRIGV